MKKSIILISALLMTLILSACGCKHEWKQATCDTPMTCSLCDKVKGEPAGHQFMEATCTAPKTCLACQVTDGDPLPHTPGEEITSVDILLCTETRTRSCTVCGSETEKTVSPISLIEDGLFTLSPSGFIYRLNHIYEEMGMTGWEAGLLLDETDVLKALIFHDGIEYASITFNTPNNDPSLEKQMIQMTQEQDEEPIICQVAILINFYEIVQQQEKLEPANTKDEVKAYVDPLLNLLSDIDTLYHNIVVPVLKSWDPELTDSQIEKALTVYKSNTLLSDLTFGELSVQYLNGFSVMLCHIIAVSSSPDYVLNPATE